MRRVGNGNVHPGTPGRLFLAILRPVEHGGNVGAQREKPGEPEGDGAVTLPSLAPAQAPVE